MLRAQFVTQVDPADASDTVVGFEDESVARAEGNYPNVRGAGPSYSDVRRAGFSFLIALAIMLAMYLILLTTVTAFLIEDPVR